MTREAVLLTGGKSSRMGENKALLEVCGEPLADRIVRLLNGEGWPVTVLGREPVGRAAFLPDEREHTGPMIAISRFKPTPEAVFVASCDLVRFQPAVPTTLLRLLGDAEAVVPVINGRSQPLCAVYRSDCFDPGLTAGHTRMSEWLDQLEVGFVDESQLQREGIDPAWVVGCNTLEEFQAAVSQLSTSGQ